MDEGIGDQFADGHFREHRDLLAESSAEHFVVRSAGVDVTDEAFEAVRVAFCPHLLVEGDDAGAALIVDDTKGLAVEAGEVGEGFRKEQGTKVQDGPFGELAAADLEEGGEFGCGEEFEFVARRGRGSWICLSPRLPHELGNPEPARSGWLFVHQAKDQESYVRQAASGFNDRREIPPILFWGGAASGKAKTPATDEVAGV